MGIGIADPIIVNTIFGLAAIGAATVMAGVYWLVTRHWSVAPGLGGLGLFVRLALVDPLTASILAMVAGSAIITWAILRLVSAPQTRAMTVIVSLAGLVVALSFQLISS